MRGRQHLLAVLPIQGQIGFPVARRDLDELELNAVLGAQLASLVASHAPAREQECRWLQLSTAPKTLIQAAKRSHAKQGSVMGQPSDWHVLHAVCLCCTKSEAYALT